jgi:hypothetical protein|tara:strand:- start:508 stop:1530 length:1023 start_codon:yes stop_codon:yes gene_type:complete
MQDILLSDPSPCLRALVLRDLLQRKPSDPELKELTSLRQGDPLVADLVALQREDGSWSSGDGAWRGAGSRIIMTSHALYRLGFMGFDSSFGPLAAGVEYLFSRQQKDGSWPLANVADSEEDDLSNSPLQTAFPLRAVANCGYSQDPRSERAYQWLLEQRLDDGAWPAGYAEGNLRGIAGYRRLAHSRWGCRSNTTAALQCLVLHPGLAKGSEASRALELLLGRETREGHTFGFEVVRLLGAEAVLGFISFFARFDLALMMDLAWRAGASREDDRIADMIAFAESLRGPYGLWEYSSKPQCSRWITFDVTRSLSRLDDTTDWIAQEPRTPFHPYPTRRKRF